MTKKLIAFLVLTLFGILLMSTVQAEHGEWEDYDACEDADYVFEGSLKVVGENCHDSNQISDSAVVNVDGGIYEVHIKSLRGNKEYPNQCQTNEAFYFNINGQNSFVSEDDSDPCTITERWEVLGDFEFNDGTNNIIMNTASECPPDTHANSVEAVKMCLYKVDVPVVPEFGLIIGTLTILSAVGIFFFVRRE